MMMKDQLTKQKKEELEKVSILRKQREWDEKKHRHDYGSKRLHDQHVNDYLMERRNVRDVHNENYGHGHGNEATNIMNDDDLEASLDVEKARDE